MQPPATQTPTTKLATLEQFGVFLIAIMLCACTGRLTSEGGDTPNPITPDAGAAATVTYRPTIQADLENLGCTATADCHGQSGVPMTVMPAPASDEQWSMNFDEVIARATNAPASLLLTKPTGLGGHPNLLPTSSPILARWLDWIELGMPYAPE